MERIMKWKLLHAGLYREYTRVLAEGSLGPVVGDGMWESRA